MEGATPLDDDRVLKEEVAARQLREVGDPLTEQHGDEADTHLVDQTEVERLLGDRRARDGDVLIAA